MKKAITLGLGHGLNDFVAGYLIGSLLTLNLPIEKAGLMVFVYNVVAFGGQVPLAFLFRKKYAPRLYLHLAFTLIAFSVLVFRFSPETAILLSAISSAIIHVVGGYECSGDEKKSAGLGVFASPGVIGLAAGGFLAHANISITIPVILGCVVFSALLFLLKFENELNATQEGKEVVKMEKHDLIMIVLLTAIGLRSAVWNIFQFINEKNYLILLYIGVSAALGKLAGGFLSDKIGHRRYTIASLVISIPLLTFFKNHLVVFCAGIFFLQSTFTSSTRILINYFKKSRFIGVSLAFGASLLIAGVFSTLSGFINNVFLTAGGLLLCVFLFLLEKRTRSRNLE